MCVPGYETCSVFFPVKLGVFFPEKNTKPEAEKWIVILQKEIMDCRYAKAVLH